MSKIFDLKQIENNVIEHLKKYMTQRFQANIFDLGLIYEIRFEERDNYLSVKLI